MPLAEAHPGAPRLLASAFSVKDSLSAHEVKAVVSALGMQSGADGSAGRGGSKAGGTAQVSAGRGGSKHASQVLCSSELGS